MGTINDPNGNAQAVQSNGFALNYCASMDMAAHAGDEGDTYSMIGTGDPGGSDQDILYIKNSSDKMLRIYKIKAWCTADVQLALKVGCTGTPTGGTTATPINALVGSGNTADGTFEYLAGDMALTGGSVFDNLFIDTTVNPFVEEIYPGEIALEKNQTFLINAVTDPNASVEITVFFYYHEKIEKP